MLFISFFLHETVRRQSFLVALKKEAEEPDDEQADIDPLSNAFRIGQPATKDGENKKKKKRKMLLKMTFLFLSFFEIIIVVCPPPSIPRSAPAQFYGGY